MTYVAWRLTGSSRSSEELTLGNAKKTRGTAVRWSGIEILGSAVGAVADRKIGVRKIRNIFP